VKNNINAAILTTKYHKTDIRITNSFGNSSLEIKLSKVNITVYDLSSSNSEPP